MSWHKKGKANTTKLRLLRTLVQFVMFILMNLSIFIGIPTNFVAASIGYTVF